MTPWLEANLELLQTAHPGIEVRVDGEVHWVRIPSYPVPAGVWTVDAVELAFRVPSSAGEAPYAFWVRPGLALKAGGAVGNYTYPSTTPWGGDWGQFSFAPEGPWQPKADVRSGVNMLDFVRGIGARLGEGA